jgi:hypothetical protein
VEHQDAAVVGAFFNACRLNNNTELAKKFAGCSWVYLDNEVHSFTSGDRTHTKAESIYSMLEFLKAELYEIAGAFR